MSVTFRTILRLEGPNATGIHVPLEVMAALDGRKRVPVVVTINGHSYRSTVVPYTGEPAMLPLAAVHREAAGVRAGEEIEVTLEVDNEPRVAEIPPELAEALAADPAAAAFFATLSYSNKRVFTLNVEGTSNPETKARRVAKAIELLREGRVR
jgi:Bacteriocin-protection, YdeI or OmpD-Associated/Domain of unknown function (DUF1905)